MVEKNHPESSLPLWLAILALGEQATRDGLTGLRNRRYFDDALADHIAAASRYGRPLALALFDLDRFKSINDTLGHAEGDAALRHFARTLEKTARAADIACRIGGDEFAVILPETSASNGWKFVERLFQALEKSSNPWNLSATAGVADLATSPNLLASADADLLARKAGTPPGGSTFSNPARPPGPIVPPPLNKTVPPSH